MVVNKANTKGRCGRMPKGTTGNSDFLHLSCNEGTGAGDSPFGIGFVLAIVSRIDYKWCSISHYDALRHVRKGEVTCMRHRKAGKITDNLWYLGREETGVYVLEGEESSMLINGGICYILPDVLQQMGDLHIHTEKINKLLILHSHFDHIGIVPYFARAYPGLEVYASARTWGVLTMPKAIEIINDFGKIVSTQMGAMEELDAFDYQWRDDVAGLTVAEGDSIDLGGVTLSILDTPGHSSCSISAYEPTMKALFASDAGGIPYRNSSFPSANSNFDQFQESLEKLKPLDVAYLCADHYGYITEDEANRFVDITIEEAHKLREEIEKCYRELGDLDAAAKVLNASFFEKNPDYVISPDILEGVFKQMLKHVAKTMQ